MYIEVDGMRSDAFALFLGLQWHIVMFAMIGYPAYR